mgnify:CR=1 FL=1
MLAPMDTEHQKEAEPRQSGAYSISSAQAQMRKGFLEFSVLLVIGSGRAYASDILRSLKAAHLVVVEGTLYPLLSRLKRSGLVSYEWKESRSGPPRKYYSITAEGTRILHELKETWTSLHFTITKLTKAYEKNH